MARRFKRQKSKYEDKAMWIDTVVTGIDVFKLPVGQNGRTKTVFTCKAANPEGQLCIGYDIWNLNIGDKIMLKGRFSDSVFLVWDLLITEKKHA